MDTETFSLASQQMSATQKRSDIIRTSHRKSIQISDSSVVRDGGVFDTIRSKTWRSISRLRKEHHEHFDQCGLVAQRNAMNISL